MIRLVAISILVGILLSGCSGCSESGIRHQAAQNLQNESHNSRTESASPSQTNQSNSRERQPNLLTGSGEATLSSLYSASKSAVFTVYTSDNEKVYQGSGFFVNSDGLAVSNYHIFEGTLKGNEMILTESGDEYQIRKVLEQDKDKDYIIFEVDGAINVNYINIANISPQIGENVFAIGNPRGLNQTLSTGIISGYRFNDEIIQTTAEITHGSSGGALMNMNGEVIGITTSGIGEANLNFAVNIKELNLQRFLK